MDSEQHNPVEIKDNDVLAGYVKELAEDVKLTQYNLREKSLMCSSIWAKWLSYLYKEKENLQRIQDIKQKVLKKKMAEQGSASLLKAKQEDSIKEHDQTMQKLTALNKKT